MITETKTRQVEPDITVVEIAGRLSLGNVLLSLEHSLKRLIQDGARKLVIDVSSLDSIDSAGIGMLVSCSGELEQAGGRMRVAGARGSVAKAFEMIHIDRIASVDTDVEAACRHLSTDSTSA